jgi:holo-[acyl-carrier protein] synthase
MKTPSSAQVLDFGKPTAETSSQQHHRELNLRANGRGDRSSSVRVGVDLVVVSDVARSLKRFGDRYLDRIFTPHELACCRTGDRSHELLPDYSVESLAARFAAKEATLKVLRPVGPRPDWRSIEVRRDDGGWCEIRLRGRAAALAADAGIDELAVSLTHETLVAAAVVVGTCRSGNRPVDRNAPAWRED